MRISDSSLFHDLTCLGLDSKTMLQIVSLTRNGYSDFTWVSSTFLKNNQKVLSFPHERPGNVIPERWRDDISCILSSNTPNPSKLNPSYFKSYFVIF